MLGNGCLLLLVSAHFQLAHLLTFKIFYIDFFSILKLQSSMLGSQPMLALGDLEATPTVRCGVCGGKKPFDKVPLVQARARRRQVLKEYCILQRPLCSKLHPNQSDVVTGCVFFLKRDDMKYRLCTKCRSSRVYYMCVAVGPSQLDVRGTIWGQLHFHYVSCIFY